MNLAKKYAAKSTKQLIKILEQQNDFSKAALEAAEAELNFRELEDTILQDLMEEVNRERIRHLLNTFNPLNDELVLPESYFLSPQRMKTIFKEEFEDFMEKKDGFRFDVWKYAIGGL